MYKGLSSMVDDWQFRCSKILIRFESVFVKRIMEL